MLSPRASTSAAAAATSGSLSANFWQQRMPAFPSGSYPPGPGSGLSRESSRDDLTSVELEQVFEYEERFRVDRRKLELLILGRFDPIKETAVDFFQKVSFTSLKWKIFFSLYLFPDWRRNQYYCHLAFTVEGRRQVQERSPYSHRRSRGGRDPC